MINVSLHDLTKKSFWIKTNQKCCPLKRGITNLPDYKTNLTNSVLQKNWMALLF